MLLIVMKIMIKYNNLFRVVISIIF